MGNSSQFRATIARWQLFAAIQDKAVREIEIMNHGRPDRECVTLTARVSLRDEFEVYRQPEGVTHAKMVKVAWMQDRLAIQVSAPGGATQTFDVAEDNGRLELSNTTVDKFVAQILGQVP